MTGDSQFDAWLTVIGADSIIDTDLYGQVLYWLSKSQSVDEATLANLVKIYGRKDDQVKIDERISKLFLALMITDFRIRGYLIVDENSDADFIVDDDKIKQSVSSFPNPNLDQGASIREPYEFGSARHLELKVLYYPRTEKSKMVPVGGYDKQGNPSAEVPY
ncbi:hypothetical protein ACYATP_08395 [Lactobacillaceae bacterium Melli_B4]